MPGVEVETLEGELGPEVYHQLLNAFVEDLEFKLVELRHAAAAGDIPRARAVAHQIKGTALSFGAVRLDGLAKDLLRLDQAQRDLLLVLVDDVADALLQLRSLAIASS